MTRVCVPTNGVGGLDASVGEHFGRVSTYTILDTDKETTTVVDNESEHMGGSGYPAEILSKLGIDVLLCRGLGRRAVGMLSEDGIEIYIGEQDTARRIIDAWKAGFLSRAAEGDACTRHVFHDHH
jgi:predicted Fe-Mo cluster-binding NifX family protein